MPTDAIVVVMLAAAGFGAFAGALYWPDLKTCNLTTR
jgi:hypothetical protein